MGSFSLSSGDLFLRSAGKNRIMVVKLTSDVNSSVVEKKVWEVVDTIGSKMKCDSLEIFGHMIKGQVFEKLAVNLCQSRLWVNKDGICFVRLGITSLSFHVMFYKTNELFNWDDYGVKKLDPNSVKNDDDKSLEDLKKELKEYKDKLKTKEDEIKTLKAKTPEKADHKLLEDSKKEVKELKNEIKKKDGEITTLKEKVKKLNELNRHEKDTAKETKDKLDKEITKLKAELKRSHEEKDSELKKKDAEILKLEGKISSSTTVSVVTPYDQILHKWRRPVLSIRFTTVSSNSYAPDFSSMPTYRAVDEYVQGRYPYNVTVYVSNASFQKDNWWFIKIKDENSSYESLFAFYGGVYDSIVTNPGGFHVKIPFSSSAIVRANVRFQVVALRGYGAVFGFCYNH